MRAGGWTVDDEKAVSKQSPREKRLALTFDGGNKCLIAWEDGRDSMTTGMDIYGDFGARWDSTPPDANIDDTNKLGECVCGRVHINGVARDADGGYDMHTVEYRSAAAVQRRPVFAFASYTTA